MASASDSTRTPSRRAFFAHAALSGYAATLPPIFIVAGTSALAQACDAAAKRYAWVTDPAQSEDEWPDERMSGEINDFSDVLERSIREPSANLGDVAAKARLVLADRYEEAGSGYVGDRALVALLQEVAALGS